MRVGIIIFILLFQIHPNSTTTVTKENCQALNDSMFHGDSCLVLSQTDKRYAAAKSSCTDFTYGHLVFLLTLKTMNAIQQLIGSYIRTPLNWWFAFGLYQVDRSEEPAGGWTWLHADGRQWVIADQRLILWNTSTGQPTNNGGASHAGYYVHGDGLNDGHEFSTTPYICEYERRTKLYKLAGKNKIGHNATYLAESTTAENRIQCGKKCAEVLICRGFSYKQSDSHCILHSTTSDGISALAPVQNQGYDMYDSHY